MDYVNTHTLGATEKRTKRFNLSTEALARASGRRPWITIGAWLVGLAVAIVLTGALLGDTLTTEDRLTNNP